MIKNSFKKYLSLVLMVAVSMSFAACNVNVELDKNDNVQEEVQENNQVLEEAQENNQTLEEVQENNQELEENENNKETGEKHEVSYSFLTAEECAEELGSLDEYYADINQKSLDFFVQKKDATIEEFREYSMKQARDFSDEDKAAIDEMMGIISNRMDDYGISYPFDFSVSFAKTTMAEALGAGGYTHGTTIYLCEEVIELFFDGYKEDMEEATRIIAHEIFHCMTRSNPDFRKDMYEIIDFTIAESDFDIPESVHEAVIANPDVEHHDSYGTFTINGEKKDCYLVFLSKDVFENPGDSFFDSMYTGLVDIEDGSLYSYEEAEDFYDVMGYNTTYCEDPEECMATNFEYAVYDGMNGPDGEGYPTPEIIEAIINYLKVSDDVASDGEGDLKERFLQMSDAEIVETLMETSDVLTLAAAGTYVTIKGEEPLNNIERTWVVGPDDFFYYNLGDAESIRVDGLAFEILSGSDMKKIYVFDDRLYEYDLINNWQKFIPSYSYDEREERIEFVEDGDSIRNTIYLPNELLEDADAFYEKYGLNPEGIEGYISSELIDPVTLRETIVTKSVIQGDSETVFISDQYTYSDTNPVSDRLAEMKEIWLGGDNHTVKIVVGQGTDREKEYEVTANKDCYIEYWISDVDGRYELYEDCDYTKEYTGLFEGCIPCDKDITLYMK